MMDFRIGHGVDIHKLKKNIPLILGGVTIESSYGIEGHSDGDVLIHSIVDAILGSVSLGDIGTYFSSNNQKWKNCKSQIFLEHAMKKLGECNFIICNLDCTIILESPQLNPYIQNIRQHLSKLINIPIDYISIKATTTDKLGFIGKKEGVAAMASVLVKKKSNDN
tara:strand:- start:1121 stop:1615 length:495 start_codon:yes stop_codon:yes gene_type:complete